MLHQTVPLYRPAQCLSNPIQCLSNPFRCSQTTVLPFLQRHSVPVPYRGIFGLYSCYQGNRGTQSP